MTDPLGRPVQVATYVNGATYTMSAGYDGNSRLTSVSYASGFTAKYAYTNLGYANEMLDATSGLAYWTASAMDAEGHITQQTAGNGLVTTRAFSLTTGRLNSIATGSGGAVQNFAYSYDLLGNPLSRSDANTGLSETLAYDGLNRLTSSTVNLSPALVKTFDYSPIGNILSKSDVGTYAYPAAGSPQPHAVMSISGGAISTSFAYDANGNQTSGLGRSIVFTSYNKPASITQGARTISFLDDTDHQRFAQITPEGTTLYISAFGVMEEVQNPGTMSQKWTDYLSVGNAKVGMRVLQAASETLSTRYFHTDHLGSISVITDENGLVVERLSYDAWGKRRFANGADDPTGSITSETTHGFTGQEELSVSGLVHLNGRVYDPLLARFTSPDTTTESPFDPQDWNRYSYVGNDPLAFTDPSGHCFLGCFWQHIVSNPIVRAVVQIVATVVLAAVLTPVAVAAGFAAAATTAATVGAAALSASIVTGLSGGNLGQILRAGLIAGATAFGFAEVASLTPGAANPLANPAAYAENVAGHALVGCVSSVASGGSCGSGALSAAVTAGAGPLINGQNQVAALVENAVLGGAASVAGGGKFANGAVTGAFGYLVTLGQTTDPRMEANDAEIPKGGGPIGFLAELLFATIQSRPAMDPTLADAWNMPPIARGNFIEDILSGTEYNGWYRVGAENGGTFPLVDFQKGQDLVSLKTVEPVAEICTGR